MRSVGRPARSNDLSASRCEKTARDYGAFVVLARASILIKSVHRASESPRIWVKIIQISVADEVLRRHSLDRMIVFGEAHLRRILGARMRNCSTVATAPAP